MIKGTRLKEISGRAGTGVKMSFDPRPDASERGTAIVRASARSVDEQATLSAWFLTLPGQAVWSNYVLCVVHLRDIEGQSKPAFKQYPEAAYELLMAALSPGANPVADDAATWAKLTPINHSEHRRARQERRPSGRLDRALRPVAPELSEGRKRGPHGR